MDPEFLKMLACDFLLKLNFNSYDFEPLLAKTDQVLIFGLLSAKSPVVFRPGTSEARRTRPPSVAKLFT